MPLYIYACKKEQGMKDSHLRLKLACYSTGAAMAVVSNMPPILFITFNRMYGISFTMLGFLVLLNFSMQLLIDLAFSFYSHKFNIPLAVKVTPFLTFVGLLIYTLWPILSPTTAYAGMLIGTLFFAVSGGLAEVLISPVIAALPSDNPDREMSKLHSVYAWGVVFVTIISAFYIVIFKDANWYWLALAMSAVPLFSFILYLGAELPQIKTPERVSSAIKTMKNKWLWVCVLAIFFGGAAEVSMAQWSSGFLEQGLGLPKFLGDVFGVALFAVMLGLGRTLYSKIGKNIYRVLLFGMIGAAVCYLTVVICNVAIVGVFACAFTGLCTSMLWPGSLIVAENKIPNGGVFIFAMMAAGGDLGASVVPQLIGITTDSVMQSQWAVTLSQKLALTPEGLGMKAGMLIAAIFCLVAIPLYIFMYRRNKN